jgi:hypothetical protein
MGGAKADKMAAEAHREGSIRGNQNRSQAVPKSAQPGTTKQAPKRDDIVVNLAKADGVCLMKIAEGLMWLFNAVKQPHLPASGVCLMKIAEGLMWVVSTANQPHLPATGLMWLFDSVKQPHLPRVCLMRASWPKTRN